MEREVPVDAAQDPMVAGVDISVEAVDSAVEERINRGYRGLVRDLFHDKDIEPTLEELARCKEVINVGLMSDKLPDQTRRVLVLRYGLDGKTPKTMEEAGREVGNVTRERVRQIQYMGLRILSRRETSHRMISRRGTGTAGMLEEILGRSRESDWGKARIRRIDNL